MSATTGMCCSHIHIREHPFFVAFDALPSQVSALFEESPGVAFVDLPSSASSAASGSRGYGASSRPLGGAVTR